MQQVSNNFLENNEETDDWVSRSSKKRHSHYLREIGKKIVALSDTEFSRINFGSYDSLKDACIVAKGLKPRSEELRRHLLHVESLMRSVDEETIKSFEETLEAIQSKLVAGNAELHRIEMMRDAIISEGMPAINKIMADHQEYDRQKLRSLMTKAQKELASDNPEKRYYRKLFKYLRDQEAK